MRSKRLYGGELEDYIPVHTWFDKCKQIVPDVRHRLVLHHHRGAILANEIFKDVPHIADVSKQHIEDDFGWFVQTNEVLDLLNYKSNKKFNLARAKENAQRVLSKKDRGKIVHIVDFFARFNVPSHNQNWRLLTNAFGIWLAEDYFGVTLFDTPTRFVCEKFVRGGWGVIPTVQDIFTGTIPEKWMFANARSISKDGMFTTQQSEKLNSLTNAHMESII